MEYTEFLQCHKALNDIESNKQWKGTLYLPPCTCYTSTKCAQSISTSGFDFSSFSDIVVPKLVNLCKFIDPACHSYTHKSLTLCQKYSLHSIQNQVQLATTPRHKVQIIKQSDEYESKKKLLQSDMRLLFPLSGSNFTFKSRDTNTSIKFQISCNKKAYDSRCKNKSSKGITRNCETSKPCNKQHECNFCINIFLDIYTLDWFMKWVGNITHDHHHPKSLDKSTIGQSQLTDSMIQDINKLHKCNVSSAIQQNVLMVNRDVSIPIMTILNKHYTDTSSNGTKKTDFEELLDTLKAKQNITYFVMYADSTTTPLLTIAKKKRANNANRNNIALSGYVSVYNHTQTAITPQIDSAQQKVLKQMLVRDENTHKLKVVLAIGWARDDDLMSFRKCPETIKLDCTFNTNREGRPLFNFVAKDANSKLYTVMRCLLPSEKSAVFNTILTSVLPKIFGEKTCNRIHFVITDGDAQEIKACQNACRNVFKNAYHVNCMWHLIHNNISKSKVIYNPTLRNILKHWLYFTARHTENDDESKQSLAYLKYYLYKRVKETRHLRDNRKICQDQVENALHEIKNGIIDQPTFTIRHHVLGLRMFDEFTSSNAEAEHSALKRSSLGMNANQKVTTLFEKTDMSAENKSMLRHNFQANNLDMMNVQTQCLISKLFVKKCYDALAKNCDLATKCVSKQVDKNNWIVIYRRMWTHNYNYYLHFLPMIQRKRYVKCTNGYLSCSCKMYERYGYPCHHMLHIVQCFKTNDIKREWIHIRWSKDYLLNYLNSSTSKEHNDIYDKLYDNQPKGIKHIYHDCATYPQYKGFENSSVCTTMFDVPDSQFMCQRTLSLWVESNKTNDPELMELLNRDDHEMISQDVILSQQQNDLIIQSQTDDFQLNDNNNNDMESNVESQINDDEEVKNWNDNVGLLKRAFQLAGGNVNKHRQLYNCLNNFILEHEINHDDNDEVFANRDKDDVVIISSNRIVNKRHKSMKRKKASYEK